MADSIQSRKFTAELRRARAALSEDSAGGHPDTGEIAAFRHQELLEAIRGMEHRLAGLINTATNPPATSQASSPPSDEDRMTELLQELHTLQQSIENTRREIAELRASKGDRATPLITAGDELDAVVQATEAATDNILAAAERIDDVVSRLRNEASGDDDTSGIEEIADQVIKIFESCNFQDITGQRITKVVNAMKFVEEKVERMIANLGGDETIDAAIVETVEAGERDPLDESHLLEGPQLREENKVSQDDIDKLFG